MWFLFALITFLAWGTADLFYKKGSVESERYSHLKTSIMVGIVMGITAIGTIVFKGIDYDPMNLLIYLPVSAMYILSMTVGYFGLRYLELSVSSPIQNASGVVSALIIMITLQQLPTALEGVAIVLITVGVILLGILEKQKENALRLAEQQKKPKNKIIAFLLSLYYRVTGKQPAIENDKKYRIGFIAFFMPIFYCIIDSLGTALDGIYLDDFTTTPLRNVTEENFEDVANISYMLTFLIVAVVLAFFVYVIKREPLTVRHQGSRGAAAICETAGQFTYVYAMSGNAMVSAPMIASYCVASVILARIFLKEKLSLKQYLSVGLVFAGILLLGILEGLAE